MISFAKVHVFPQKRNILSDFFAIFLNFVLHGGIFTEKCKVQWPNCNYALPNKRKSHAPRADAKLTPQQSLTEAA